MKNILYQESIVEIKHLFRMMRNTVLALFIFAGTAFATESYSQTMKVTVVANNISTGKVIHEIEKQTDYLFVYDVNEVNLKRNVKVNAQDKPVAEVLNKVFEGTDIYYAMEGKNIMLMSKASPSVKQTDSKITGHVVDTKGEPIIGATIKEHGTSNGTITDFDGNFTLNVSVNAIIEVSYVGYQTQKMKAQIGKLLAVTLKEDTEVLDEVVVVGYGTQKKSDLTGSVTMLNSKDLTNMPATTITDALVGKIAGALVQNTSGANPSGGTTIQIRGVNSLNSAANEPLIVVDGVPLFDSNLNSIDPQNIESVNVLKDASSTAIYGSRAAAGVILVTTKRGKEGDGKISISINQGLQKMYKNYDVTDAATSYRVFESAWDTWEALAPEGVVRDRNKQKAYNDYYSPVLWDSELGRPVNDIDWKNSLVRDAAHWQKYSVGFSGGSKKVDYYINLGYEDREGIMINTDFSRITLSSNVNYAVKENVKIGLTTNISYTENSGISGLNDRFGTFMPTVYQQPWIPGYDENGELIVARYMFKVDPAYKLTPLQNTYAAENHLYNVLTQSHTGESHRVISNFYFDWKPIEGLSLKTNVGFDLGARKNKDIQYLQEKKYLEINNPSDRDMVSTQVHFTQKRNWMMNETVTYDKVFGKHHLNATGVFEIQENYSEFLRLKASGSTDNDLDQINNQPTTDVLSENGIVKNPRSFNGAPEGRLRLASFMLRVNYSFDDKYLLTATVRRDGTSRFARGNQWGTFPSIAASWKINHEKFWNKMPEKFNSLKLRASYGLTGNQASVASFMYLSNIGLGNGNFGSIYTPSNIANPDLTWETLKQFNVGLDMGFFNNRLQLSADYYHKTSSDMLGDVPLTVSSGFTTAKGNIGSIRNTGFELSVNSVNIVTRNFTWSTNLSLSHNKNEILDLGKDADGSVINDVIVDRYIRTVGEPVSNLYLYEIEGVWQLDSSEKPWGPNGFNDYGLFKIKDQNDDGKIDTEDRVRKGSPEPKISGGFTNTFTYKNFSMNVVCTYMLGNKLYNIPKAYHNWGHPQHVKDWSYAKNHWTPDNPTNEYERASTDLNRVGHLNGPSLSSDKWLEDASFLKIANLNFSYSFPKKWLTPIGLSAASLGLSVSNLYTFTKYSGLSPETDGGALTGNPSQRGVDNGGYPEARTYMMNLKVNF